MQKGKAGTPTPPPPPHAPPHGQMNYKDTEPYVGFSLSRLVNRLCGMFNRFYRLEIHSHIVGIFGPACGLLPSWTKELYLCTVARLHSLWPPLPFPPSQTKCTVCKKSMSVGGGGVLNCTVDHILQEFYNLFLTIRTYKIALPPQTKMTSKDDIKGLVSLKFLCPCTAP